MVAVSVPPLVIAVVDSPLKYKAEVTALLTAEYTAAPVTRCVVSPDVTELATA